MTIDAAQETAQPAASESPRLLEGLLTRAQLLAQLKAEGVKVSGRTLRRYEEAGLPVIKVGAHRLYDVARCRGFFAGERRGRK
jgi:hypothetical protein